jgi:CrcB protein
MKMLLCIVAGGIAGTLARYGMGGLVQRLAGGVFPFGTLSVNLLGSFILGVLWQFVEASSVSPNIRALVGIGFCGAFTTFSTLALETLNLLRDGEWLLGMVNVVASNVLGLVAVYGGMVAVRGLWALLR